MDIEQIEPAAAVAATLADERWSAITEALHPSGFCFCAASTVARAGLVERERLLESSIEEAGI